MCALSLLLSLVGEEGEVEESHLQQERTSQDAPPHPIENLVVGDVGLWLYPAPIGESGNNGEQQSRSLAEGEVEWQHQVDHLYEFEHCRAIQHIDAVVECVSGALVLPRLVNAEHHEQHDGQEEHHVSEQWVMEELHHVELVSEDEFPKKPHIEVGVGQTSMCGW